MGMPTHLSAGEVEEFGREMDSIRNEVMDSRGAKDRAYILQVIKWQRWLALTGRGFIFFSFLFSSYIGLEFASDAAFYTLLAVGVISLGLAKIIENMEIGHNVMHAQWDWMRDPAVQSNTWEWDIVCPSDQWKHSHNVVHHTWTNVFGKDPDIGYGVIRISDRQRWKPMSLFNPVIHVVLMLLFQWGVAVHDLHLGRLASGKKKWSEVKPLAVQMMMKAMRQLRKDYLLWPLLGSFLTIPVTLALGLDTLNTMGSAFVMVALANLVANGMRNVWTNVIIFCGHFPDGVSHFTKQDVEGETRAAWYVRQLLGSANIGGGKLFHILSGNLSHQIEHHLFPDLPSNRYPEIAPRVRAAAERYGLPYNTGSMTRQLGTTTLKIWRLSLP